MGKKIGNVSEEWEEEEHKYEDNGKVKNKSKIDKYILPLTQ